MAKGIAAAMSDIMMDLRDIRDDMREEERKGTTYEQYLAQCSDNERWALKRIVEYCKEILEYAEDDESECARGRQF